MKARTGSYEVRSDRFWKPPITAVRLAVKASCLSDFAPTSSTTSRYEASWFSFAKALSSARDSISLISSERNEPYASVCGDANASCYGRGVVAVGATAQSSQPWLEGNSHFQDVDGG